jgi:hypothetical protein
MRYLFCISNATQAGQQASATDIQATWTVRIIKGRDKRYEEN